MHEILLQLTSSNKKLLLMMMMRDSKQPITGATSLDSRLIARELVERLCSGDGGDELLAYIERRPSRL